MKALSHNFQQNAVKNTGDQTTSASNLEASILKILRLIGVTNIEKEVVYNFHQIPVLQTDLVFIFENKKFYVEIDGPSHFIKNNKGEYQLNNQTIIRNQFYEVLLAQDQQNQVDSCFLELPFFEINQQQRLDERSFVNYLHKKLTEPHKVSNAQTSFAVLNNTANNAPSQKISSRNLEKSADSKKLTTISSQQIEGDFSEQGLKESSKSATKEESDNDNWQVVTRKKEKKQVGLQQKK
jgi:very-short-patch-repair endonuclease